MRRALEREREGRGKAEAVGEELQSAAEASTKVTTSAALVVSSRERAAP